MIVGRQDKRTAKTLMRALCLVVIHVLANELSQMRLTKRRPRLEALMITRQRDCVYVYSDDSNARLLAPPTLRQWGHKPEHS